MTKISPSSPLDEAIRASLHEKTELPWIIGVSGGMDSIGLYHAMKRVFPNKLLHIVHINHQIAKESYQWENFVRLLCQKYGDVFSGEKVTCEPPTEDIARTQRYKVFEKILQTYDKGLLILAHHKNDQEETLLWRFLRGCPIQGLMGIEKNRDMSQPYSLIRPLLGVSREDIERYIMGHDLEYCSDPSNSDLRYTRNHIRNAIMPQIPQRAILTTERLLRYNYEALKEFMNPWLNKDDRIDLQFYPQKSLSSLWTLVSLWLSSQQCLHPSERALKDFCEHILARHEARLDLGQYWVLYYDPIEKIIYKLDAMYFKKHPKPQCIDLNQTTEGIWGIFRWSCAQKEDKTLVIRALTQNDRLDIEENKTISASALWKRFDVKRWERPFYPAVFDTEGKFFQYVQLYIPQKEQGSHPLILNFVKQ
jgi:tRNA(Ile)-lysidine synthetase-like protein